MAKIFGQDHDKYINTQEFNKFTGENFAVRLAQAKLATKAGMNDSVEKTDSDDKLKELNKKVTSSKTKHIEAVKKLTDLTNKVAQISEKNDFLIGRFC